ncbi:uncharacterized protein K441DRAFT_78430 [Cenococcum geophilum 1.58]|uniref:uncharacterized protein n=1 Tax=Cenococcum geophilum 1.58 TaxID=794803 RepID=UPI00358F94B9|nr:hypothetical protein K441DRAFT_78430 [Cenococcum geophilum 1.58]
MKCFGEKRSCAWPKRVVAPTTLIVLFLLLLAFGYVLCWRLSEASLKARRSAPPDISQSALALPRLAFPRIFFLIPLSYCRETSSLYCNNTAIMTVLRLQETLETCPVLSSATALTALWHGPSSLPRNSPTIRVPPCPITCIRGHCRSTAARLDFNSSNTPPVEHTLRVSGTPVTVVAPAHLVSRSGQPHSPKHGTPPRTEVGDPTMLRTAGYDGNKI